MSSYFVSNNGIDNSGIAGDIDNPFKTLNYAISRITTQDTIYFRKGSYEFSEQEITNNGLSILGYNDENVTFDGTKPISDLADTSVNGGEWQTHSTTIVTDANQTISKIIYKIKLNSTAAIWQLFYNRDEIINARYPSAQWSDESVYSFNNWGHGYYDLKNNGDIEDGNGNVIGNGTGSKYYYENGEIVDVAHDNISLYDFVETQQGIDPSFTISGSLINLNVGSFRSYTKVVNSQSLANDVIRLSYDNVATWKEKHHYYYLENKLEYLNSENEWFYDNDTKYLYVWLTGDAVPTTTNIRAKQQSYSLNITADNVTVGDINFFSTTLKGNSANDLTIRDCNFLYASCYAHMLNQINSGSAIAPTTNEVFETQTRFDSSQNVTFTGSAFRYTDGDVIHTQGGGTTIKDCYFNYIDKTVCNLSSVMTTLRLMGDNNIVKNNTFRKTAASSTLNSGNAPIVEYNDLAESGYLQSDGAMIHLMVAQQSGSKIRFNWVHDTIKYGIRFDGDGEGFNGSIHHNIGWNCEGGIMVKGGELDGGVSVGGHFVYNNTFFNSVEKNDIIVLNTQKGVNINYGSVVMNNLTEKLSGHRSDIEGFEPWITASNNYTASNIEPLLTNTASYDFRPINTSSIVGAGNTTYTNFEFNPTGVDALTADIGAVEHSGTQWQAGISFDIYNRFNFFYNKTMSTFTFNNQSKGSSYVVLDPEFATSPIPSSTPKYFSNVTFSNLTNISEDNIVVNDYKLGIVVPEGNSSFDFTPSTPVPISDVIIRGAGDCSVTYQTGSTTINVTPDELNRRETGSSSAFTNPFCFQFNGNSDSVYVAGNNTALNLTSSMSISTWITIDEDVFNTGSGQKDYYIVDKLNFPSIPNNTVKGYGLYIRRAQINAPTTVKLRGLFGVNGKTIFQSTVQVDIQAGAANALASNTPHNIVITYNENAPNKNMRMYINGALVKETNNAGTFDPASTQNFIIGNASFGGGTPGIREYHGKIDEVSIWNTELTSDDVTSLYDWDTNGNLNNYVSSSNLQGWYRMGENADFNETTTGKWTLKSATNTEDNNLFLIGEGVAQGDKVSPGLVGPA